MNENPSLNQSPRVLIVEARFYAQIADEMVAGATAVLEAAGVSYAREAVPGSFELPAAIGFALEASASGGERPRFDGFIALGCVIRGETDHYDHVCREASRGLMELGVTRGIALGFGLLTCETYEQARVRAARDGGNKGADAAAACLRMIALKRHFSGVVG